jgi:hypothetical protein
MPSPAPGEIEMVRHEGYWEARYLGTYSLVGYKKQMALSVRACVSKGGKLLLVDIRKLEGYAPSVQERYELGKYGAEISKKLDRVAALGTAEQIGTDSFASLVARNRGLKIQAFNDPKAAVKWLLKG